MYRELEDFCSAIVNGLTPRSSAALGLEVVRTIEAVEASLTRRNPHRRRADECAYDSGARYETAVRARSGFTRPFTCA